jgi:hypothetical protein
VRSHARLRLLLAVAAIVGLACSCTSSTAHKRRAEPRLRTPRTVTHSAGVSWWIPARDAGGIEGYAVPDSVVPGDQVTLYVSTRASQFVVRAFRMGWYGGAEGRLVWTSAPVAGRHQSGPVFEPATTRTATAKWRPSTTVSTTGWAPGVYLLRLQAGPHHESFVPLIVRATSAAGRVVLISPTTTWQAYNLWGCCDLYEGGDGAFATRSRAVSFDRPYLAEHGTGDFIRGELSVLAEADRLRLPLDFVTDVDLEQYPDLLAGAKAVVSMGHDEYWSLTMRAALQTAVQAGTNVAFFGANGIFRRIRLASTRLGPDRLEINYKIAAEDPLYGSNDAAVTANWPAPPHPDPESSLLGDQYACNREQDRNAAGVVVEPQSWFFAGVQVTRGEQLPGLIGPETDAVQLGYPTPRPIEVVLHSPASCPGNAGPPYADASYYTAASKAGVFDAGAIAWACSIYAVCAQPVSRRTAQVTRQVTDNVLRAFAAGPAGEAHPAQDNLAALGIASH